MSKEKQIEETIKIVDEMASSSCRYHDLHSNGRSCLTCWRRTTNCDIYPILFRLAELNYRKQEWISVEERLPEENEVVLIWVGNVQVARIVKGITEEEREKMKSGELPNPIEICWSLSTGCVEMRRNEQYRSCDVFGNNLVPYSWKAAGGPMEWFGQNVSHWMPLPEPPKMKENAE